MNQKGIQKRKDVQKRLQLKTNHLLTIGINKYSNNIPILNNAVRDAQEFERIMKTRYGVTQIVSLYDEEASLKNIVAAFDGLRNKLTKEDNLIIYFSGHGELVHNRGYWIPVDAVGEQRITYLSNHEIRDLLADLKAHHILVIVDACFSGALFDRSRSSLKERYYTIPSRWVLTSGQKEPVPDGVPGDHSPFAKSLLTQLENHPKSILSLGELWINMREGIIFNSKQTPACEPVKDANHQGGEFFFIDTEAGDQDPTDLSSIVKVPPVDTSPVAPKPSPNKDITESPVVIDHSPIAVNETPTKMDIKTLKKELRKLQATGKTKEAYELLIEHLDEDSSHMTTVYIRLGNLNTLTTNIANGTAMNAPQQQAQINAALDHIIRNIEEEDLAE